MSATSPIDLTSSPVSVRRTHSVAPDEVVIISDNEDEPSHNCNYHDYNRTTHSFDNQNLFHSPTTSRHSNNNQASTINNANYNLRNGLTGLGTHGTHSSNGGGGPIRNTSTRSSRAHSRPPSTLRGLFIVSAQSNSHTLRHRQHHHTSHTSAFHPYASIIMDGINYEGSNSSGSSRLPTVPPFFEATNNSPKPTITTAGHTRDLEESHILICAGCNNLLHEKLWALNGCGHVVCGSCVDKFSGKKKIACPSCKKKPTSTLQLYV
ncbi:11376_t:CDS:2 [Funneliformis caledonium]|uniref:11376_t:CDS:1 n=1 Tax=Funneliformis caledonium TaxID=1117310 RepID=A0A9N8W0V1_9GLOM|nr:11376_t:CDS:2 [Funneliformis caledonium]